MSHQSHGRIVLDPVGIGLIQSRRQLAQGKTLEKAIATAKAYVTLALEEQLDLGQGSGPLNHGFDLIGFKRSYS
ncbi:bifunctional hydroxymethylpyrimidine kinase/phosphomethylpyrimidine kinase [Suicoccus acidiformans]|uniref:bifunctional hydroxymethylpyrimidine kinase/phosphomethylpyrimidine kinase n=1 Tax=Suicoccus acidiformans TaxID=2036206 RepID=UPI001F09ECFF|nr:bifunctional hydroxymethylpyrimidine kinase/phosphomethylpyrimidine kinase [Suicoccus acidiformans]